jgi:GNAT superfamily N-acetyltransferase
LLSGRRITRTAPAVTSRLRDDTEILIQPIAPTDGDRLIRFHESLSAETTRTRFFILHPHLTTQEVSFFTHVDHQDREAFVAVVSNDIIGVGRFDRLPNSARAEVAFVVADRWQGLGLATLLFHRLADRAISVGIRQFVAETLVENRPMLALFEHTGMVTHRTTDHGVVELEMDVVPVPANGSNPGERQS